jgi:hypothetical protein
MIQPPLWHLFYCKVLGYARQDFIEKLLAVQYNSMRYGERK